MSNRNFILDIFDIPSQPQVFASTPGAGKSLAILGEGPLSKFEDAVWVKYRVVLVIGEIRQAVLFPACLALGAPSVLVSPGVGQALELLASHPAFHVSGEVGNGPRS